MVDDSEVEIILIVSDDPFGIIIVVILDQVKNPIRILICVLF